MTSPQNCTYRKLIFVKLTLHLCYSKLPLSILINRIIRPQNCSYHKLIFVKLTLHFWHSKLPLSILINRITSPQNCSYSKSIFVSLTSHLWQITVKFNTTPLIYVIAKFNIKSLTSTFPQASISKLRWAMPSLTSYLQHRIIY